MKGGRIIEIKIYSWIWNGNIWGPINRYKDRKTERQKDKKADRQTDRLTERQIDRLLKKWFAVEFETVQLTDIKTERQKDK